VFCLHDFFLKPKSSFPPKLDKRTKLVSHIVTGDVFVSSEATTRLLRKEMNANAVEIEGAAVAQVCWQQHKPFIVIRSVTDNVGNTAVTDIRNFMKQPLTIRQDW
jgi:adenosylhomocysteine nucleosidase